MVNKKDFSLYENRRKELVERIEKEAKGKYSILLFANFEDDRAFIQESNFYYFTGLQEPGLIVKIDSDGTQKLFAPDYGISREKWVDTAFVIEEKNASTFGFDSIEKAGHPCAGYQIQPFSPKVNYEMIVTEIKKEVDDNTTIFTFVPNYNKGSLAQRILLARFMDWIPKLATALKDCSAVAAGMRQKKSKEEIEAIFEAIAITLGAQELAAHAIAPKVNEAEIQAMIEYGMTVNHSYPAFPSIVASGKNGTVLHYTRNDAEMQKGDLVVIDIGASYKGYASDITRTYPVSGVFTKRQKELYEIVLALQEYIASIAAVGYYLGNSKHPEKSLHHLAIAYLEERGYGQYMPHGIGHYLGLEVHDVGIYEEPLKIGDVFTIEPGIYIPEENIGIRIEDDYWLTEKGLICLSEDIPKKVSDIEKFMVEEDK